MGKEGDLWDDSALINAFDEAISKYKIMHRKGGREGSPEGGKATSSTEEKLPAIGDERSDAERHMQENNNNVAPNHVTEMRETINPSSTKENNITDTYAPENYTSSSNGQDLHNANSNTQDEEDYNRLLNQYYELEEQREKILQQLYQFGSSNVEWGTTSASHENQVPASQVVQWGTTAAAHENHIAAAQASCPAVASCCSFACPCSVGPCASLPACCVGICESKTSDYTSVNGHNRKSTSFRDGDLINTALGAAERALLSLKINSSDADKDKAGVANEGKSGQENSSETDLSVVLNAWYSAGFYTGKYVSEQLRTKK